MSGHNWLGDKRSALAADHILDRAGELFAEVGVAGVGMQDVASAAGCSRATLYRYFESKDALRIAYIHRETRRVAAEVSSEVAHVDDPRERLVEAVVGCLRRVRGTPVLAAWFAPGDAGGTAATAHSSAVIEDLAAGLLGDAAGEAELPRARWVVRVVLSLLSIPGADEQEERAMLEHFLVPAVLPRVRTRAT